MSSNYQPQQKPYKQNIKTCYKCNKQFNVFSSFSESICTDCYILKREQERKEERAMWKAYCPFCHMLLAEHKEMESKKCLYNLRGYVNIITERSSE